MSLRPLLAIAAAILVSSSLLATPGRAQDAVSTDDLLESMTLEQKVAQLFATSVSGLYMSADDARYRSLIDLVERVGIGGVIFFRGEPLEQAALTNEMQRRASIPLLVSQDAEWGLGMRIDRATTFPRTMALGASGDTDLAYLVGYVTAREARAIGVHQIFAPTADVNNDPANPIINVRAFGERANRVAEMVAAQTRGLQDGGAIATLKHFPGHGDTNVDSHMALPVLEFDRRRLDTLELVPFRAGVAAGARSVMTGHLWLPELEPEPRVSASISPAVTSGLLRGELGFDGLVVTDALNMDAVTDHFGTGDIAVRALAAGADMLLMSEDIEAAIGAVLDAIEDGRISETRVDEAVGRILDAKQSLGLFENQLVDLEAARQVVSSGAHRAAAMHVARSGLTLLRNEDDVLPLHAAGRRALVITLSDGDDAREGRDFADRIRSVYDDESFDALLLDRRSHPSEFEAALTAAAETDVVIVSAFTYVRAWSGRINLSEHQVNFVNRLMGIGVPVVMVAFGNPYMASGIEAPDAYLAAFGTSSESQIAAADALLGRAEVTGRLPITIPNAFTYGAGIDLQQIAPRRGFPEEVGLDGRRLAAVDSLIRAAINRRAFPGAAVAIGRESVVAKLEGYGHFTYERDRPVTEHSLFDLASLTKVIATTTAVMKLFEEGRIDLDAPLARYLPEFGRAGKQRVTVRQVLTHQAGLIPYRPFHRMGIETREQLIEAIMNEELQYRPGSDTRYSDLGMISLALAIERIAGQNFADYTREQVFQPLGMTSTGFRATGETDENVVPTEVDDGFRGRLLQGEVHDEAAWLLGGTAGHAGLFSTAADLARFAHMMVNDGRINGVQFLKPETIRLFTTRVNPRGSTRAIGWDTRSDQGYSSAGTRFGPRSFGHTGFTGTSIWIDPDQKLYVILLSNRVHPTRENNRHVQVRSDLADIAYGAIAGPASLLMMDQLRKQMQERQATRQQEH